ncbi:hypothetical protein [Massilia forsythiae]|uniref:hypothetical protein n=1 Tax=Massilia forsythiae TaxID=2728020 RepID=UPI00280493F2|nr:hypothetical protein [Massilia forsythiae]
MIRVQVFRRDELLGDLTTEDTECFLGKDAGSLLTLTGWRVGRRQLQISVVNGGVFIKDGGGSPHCV